MIELFSRLVFFSVVSPKRGGHVLLQSQVTPAGLVHLAALVFVLSAIAIILGNLVNQEIQVSARSLIGLQVLSFVVMTVATYFVGRLFGGTGTFQQTVLVICWLDIVLAICQIIQLLFVTGLSAMPFLGGLGALLVSLATAIPLFLFFWLYANFVTVLHGFQSAAKVLGVMLLGMFAMSIFLLFVVSVISPA